MTSANPTRPMMPGSPAPGQQQSQRFSLAALFSIGFRPFYLAGSLYAVISMLIWIVYLFDFMEISGPFAGMLWHSHELVFGFGSIILFGFLFTAVRNWTRQPTPAGWPLAALLIIWIAGRVGLIIGEGPLVAIIDLAFLPLATIAIAIPLVRAQNRRNYFTIGLLGLLFLANLAFYAVAYDWLDVEASTIFLVAVDVFAIFITVIAGRIIPIFSNNATGTKRAKRIPWLEHTIVAAMSVMTFTDAFLGQSDEFALPRAILLLMIVALNLAKMAAWQPQITRIDPILWILPLSYAWLPIAFFLRALSLLDGPVEQNLALHGLTAGAMGGMMLAIMTRSSLGHSGRKITAGWAETCIFCLVSIGAIIRVFGPLIAPQLYLLEIAISALFWMLAFGLFALRYWPILSRPRL